MATCTVPAPNPHTDSQPLRHENGYHLQANGEAIETVRAHSEPQELTLFGDQVLHFAHPLLPHPETYRRQLLSIRSKVGSAPIH